MGCFLACFGFKEKKKRRKPGKKNPSTAELDNQSYVPLDSNVSIKLDVKENLSTSDTSQLKEKPKEPPSILKLKKKVRFNLNVKAYEPIPDNYEVGMYLSEDEEETKNTAGLHYEEDAIASYPASYRYQNCRYSDDEEDEDLKLDQVDDFSSNESDTWVSDDDVETSVELQGIESKSNARRYVCSVLCPVENLSQWKLVKAKAATSHSQLKLQKENFILSSTNPHTESLKMRNTNAIDASLSNWLSSLETCKSSQPK